MSISKTPPGAGARVACWPIQRIMAAGSVRCRKTSSTGAGRSMPVSNRSLTLLLSVLPRVARVGQHAFELAEMAGPEVGQELLHRAETVRVDHEEVTRALAALVDQPGLVQHLQVPGDRLAGDVEMAGDLTDRAGVAGNKLEDGAPVGFGERLEGRVGVHGCRPRNPARRSVMRASAGTATAGPIRPARASSSVRAWCAKASTWPARAASRAAGWPVALARSQPCTRMSKVVNPARTGPGMSPSGVTCRRVRASPVPAAASAAADASA